MASPGQIQEPSVNRTGEGLPEGILSRWEYKIRIEAGHPDQMKAKEKLETELKLVCGTCGKPISEKPKL